MTRTFVLILALTGATPILAQDFDGERALMRQCVEDREGDVDIAALGVGAFCTCFVNELAGHAAENPEIYFDEEAPKPYYSSKEEGEKVARKAQAMDSHVSYCKTVLR